MARKGRAFGVSVLLGTQYPTSRVIDPQVKANLPTAIAFQCRTRTESRVILDRGGAEELDRPGLALTYVGGRWRRVQVLRVDQVRIEDVAGYSAPEAPVLSDVELALVRYAVEELGGAFIVGKLYDAMGDRISRRQINKLAKRWERRGWLTEPQRDDNGYPIGRQVTLELARLATPAPARAHARTRTRAEDVGAAMMGRKAKAAAERRPVDRGGDGELDGRDPAPTHGSEGGNTVPPFLRRDGAGHGGNGGGNGARSG